MAVVSETSETLWPMVQPIFTCQKNFPCTKKHKNREQIKEKETTGACLRTQTVTSLVLVDLTIQNIDLFQFLAQRHLLLLLLSIQAPLLSFLSVVTEELLNHGFVSLSYQILDQSSHAIYCNSILNFWILSEKLRYVTAMPLYVVRLMEIKLRSPASSGTLTHIMFAVRRTSNSFQSTSPGQVPPDFLCGILMRPPL